MSLEAIAALLGHRSLSMTMVYARIADRTVADEYFAVTEKVEALYDQQPPRLPADAEGHQTRKLRAEVHQRMLGNGYCARPVELDCHFESICESCTFFVTTIQFRPTLEAQRDGAAAKSARPAEDLRRPARPPRRPGIMSGGLQEVIVNTAEARQLLAAKLAELRRRSYSDLLRLMEPEGLEVAGPSGVTYQLEVEAFWDDEPQRNLRVLASIDDGGWRAFHPLTDDFIVAPDGSFVGE
jgi:hypothetical protein